jgi:hypothetical protein
MLSWVHLGDLHVGADDDWESAARLASAVDLINEHLAGAIDFVFLCGDNANHGSPAQYERIAAELARLQVPWRCIPGDHDFEPGDLDAYAALPHSSCPFGWTLHGYRCLFLDIVSHGAGGPDFRLGHEQRAWLARELADCLGGDLKPVVFMHAYPGDLAEEGSTLATLFAQAGVVFVDTGHTHYNELLNDGRVLYGATRSTGQIEEDDGRPGLSIVHLDGDSASWRFQRLDDPWPLLMIVAPPDARLTTRPRARDASDIAPSGRTVVRACVLGNGQVDAVTLAGADAGDAPGATLHPVPGRAGLWQAEMPVPVDPCHPRRRLHVQATLADGRVIEDSVLVAAVWPQGDAAPGTDAWAVRPWPEHGLLGTQLGPNKEGGRSW